MNIVTNYEATGHSGSFSTTSGIYTVAGDLTTDGVAPKAWLRTDDGF